MGAGGRPTTYTPETASAICAGIASGKLLPQVCAQKGMPCTSTVFLWLTQHPEFSEQYTRAKEVQVEVIAADTQNIADKSRKGKKTELKHVGWCCPTCGKDARWRGSGWIHSQEGNALCEPKAEKIFEEKVVTGDMVERARLQVDTRKWLLSKMAPKKYGDRLELAGDAANPINITVAETLRQKRAERSKKSEESAT